MASIDSFNFAKGWVYMNGYFEINGRRIGPGCSPYVVAEISANHSQNFEQAAKLIKAASEAGADAIKLQTYTPDTLTIDCNNEYFQINGTPWDGRTLYDLYKEVYMPWEWQPKLKAIAEELNLDLFSTAFDPSAVDFLEDMGVPVHKVASFEIVDIPLIEHMARKGKPIIISTGMATQTDIEESVQAARNAGATQIALLKCTSAYPASPEEMNLRTIPHLAESFNVPVGLSDHTLGFAVPVSAIVLGACIVEKHFTLSRESSSPDSAFSLEPNEFKTMVDAIRVAEKALGEVRYGVTEREASSHIFRRSLFVINDMKAGQVLTDATIRSIRPGYGLPPTSLREVIGKRAAKDIKKGTPLSWAMISD